MDCQSSEERHLGFRACYSTFITGKLDSMSSLAGCRVRSPKPRREHWQCTNMPREILVPPRSHLHFEYAFFDFRVAVQYLHFCTHGFALYACANILMLPGTLRTCLRGTTSISARFCPAQVEGAYTEITINDMRMGFFWLGLCHLLALHCQIQLIEVALGGLLLLCFVFSARK